MRNRTMRISAGLLVVLAVAQLQALELKEGRMKLVLHEAYGRFSLEYLADVSKGRYVPLFVDTDPRTTMLSVLVGNTVYRMGDSSQFTQELFRTSKSAGFLWESSALTVRQEFFFIRSQGSLLSDGIGMTVTVTNKTEGSRAIGVRYLFDTYLGEKQRTHFLTDIHPILSSETELAGRTISYLVSQDPGAKNEGFKIMTRTEGVTVPDRVVFGNWKRLSDTPWEYGVSEGRSFSLLPYSINDSAVALYYNPTPLGAGAGRTVTLYIGCTSDSRFEALPGSAVSPAGDDRSLTDVYEAAVNRDIGAASAGRDAFTAELFAVDDLIAQIDRKLASGEPILTEELAVYRKILETLLARKKNYD